ncbi:MAG: coatomer alpha subunit [Amphiamblys sp. WSBS2006]|nr:MAG: coatomer alpha subunit [Amphiamblys sp. WSBS2006]
MEICFEKKTARVKGVDMHVSRPWIVVSLHTGYVEIWDYSVDVRVVRFEGHIGPVRGCGFHKTRPLLTSGGDDCKITVYNLRTKKAIFTAKEHCDYIRSVAFSNDGSPWLVSASDDQTAKIWNWQSRECIATLAGHTNYVMCASFHPIRDIVLTGSLDSTFRLWDVSGLKKKRDAENGKVKLFSGSEPEVMHVVDAHELGVNCAHFHPTKDLIVSAGEDKIVRVWKYSDAKVWETHSIYGHTDCVMCAVFQDGAQGVLSGGEDRTVRACSYEGRDEGKMQIVKETKKARVWCLGKHPEKRLYCSGHDSGFFVFRFERDGVVWKAAGKAVFYVAEGKVMKQTLGKKDRSILFDIGKEGAVSIDVSPSGASVLVQTHREYVLHTQGGRTKKGNLLSTIFLDENRLAGVHRKKIVTRDTDGGESKTLGSVLEAASLFSGPEGSVLVVENEAVKLVDIERDCVVRERASFGGLKSVFWNKDRSLFAGRTKNEIFVFDRQLEAVAQHRECTEVTGHVWRDSGVYYTAGDSLKCLLLDGTVTFVAPVEGEAVCSVLKNTVFLLSPEKGLRSADVELAFIELQSALLAKNKKKAEMLIGQGKGLIGQGVISRIKKSAFPSLALRFVRNKREKAMLALECGEPKHAAALARELGDREVWSAIGEHSEKIGDVAAGIEAATRTEDETRRGLLAFISGDKEELKKAFHSALLAKEHSNALYLSVLLEDRGLQEKVYRETSTDAVFSNEESTVHFPCGECPVFCVTREAVEEPLEEEAEDTEDETTAEKEDETRWEIEDTEEARQHCMEFFVKKEYDSGIDVLEKQIGLVYPEKIEQNMLFVSGEGGVPEESSECLRGVFEDGALREIFSSANAAGILEGGCSETTKGRFREALGVFRGLFHFLPFVQSRDSGERDRVYSILERCREYTRGIMMELERKEAKKKGAGHLKRAMELACYFSLCDLFPQHKELTLQAAMAVAYKNGSMRLAKELAEKAPRASTQTRKILSECAGKENAIEIEYSEDAVVCSGGWTVLSAAAIESSVRCCYCGSVYKKEFSGTVCRVCEMCRVGGECSGYWS